MKKSLPIILLSVFTLAFSALGFLGVQPVKATTEVGGITISDTDVGYRGTSITYGEQVEKEGVLTTGDGKMKFYSSLPQSLYKQLKTAKENGTIYAYKTGTLIIPAQLLEGDTEIAKVNNLVVGTAQAKNIETTGVWTLYDVDGDEVEDDADDEYWAMASLYSIPRACYTEEIVARPYIAIQETESSELEYSYYLADKDPEPITKFYSLTTAALKKIEAGDYNDKEELKTAIINDYTTFKVTFHFSEVNKDMEGFVESKTISLAYDSVLPRLSTVYKNTHFENYYSAARQYTYLKGFYNKDKTAVAVQIGASMEDGDVTTAVGGSSTEGGAFYYYTPVNDTFMTRVYGDMNLYEEVAPANLIDDFSTSQSVNAAYDRQDATTYTYKKHYQNEDAAWYAEKTDVNGVTESGVLAIPSRVTKNTNAAKKEHQFFFSSALRNHYFWNNSYCQTTKMDTDGDGVLDTYMPTNADDYIDITADDFYTGAKKSDYDYVNVRVLVECSDASITEVQLEGTYGYGNYAGQNPAKTPVNTWINFRLERAQVERIFNSLTFSAYRSNNTGNPALIRAVTSTPKEEGTFTLYVDYLSYERDMRISVNGEDGWGIIENTHSHKQTNPYSVRYSKVTSFIGEEVTLGTALTNGTIVYTVTDPDGEAVDLIDGNKFTPTKFGNYTVKATCDDYALLANDYPAYDFKSKQYGEMTFEVVARKVTPTLKNAEGTAIDLETAFNIGNPVTIDFAVEGIDTILPESATYEVKYLVNDSTVEVTDGVFTPLNAGQYSVVVKYVDVNGYESASEEVILDTVGRVITPAFSVGGEVVDINNPILMDSVVTISATVEGVDAPESANFSYEVVRLDSVEENNVELEVVDGQFTAYYTGTYNIFVYYKEGQVTHASEMIVLTVKADKIYFNDFSDSTSIIAANKVEITPDGATTEEKNAIKALNNAHKHNYDLTNDVAGGTLSDGSTWTAEWHDKITDINGVTKYGVVSTRPQQDKWSQGRLGINLRSAFIRTSTNWENAGLTNIVYGTSTYPSSNTTKLGLESDGWDYVSIPVYIPKAGAEEGETISVYTVYNFTIQKVPYNTWTELKLDKMGLMLSFASSCILNQFSNNQYSFTPIFFLAPSGTSATNEALVAANKEQIVYVDSMAFKKYDEYVPFTSKTMVVEETGEEIGNAVSMNHYKPAEGSTTYEAVQPLTIVPKFKVGENEIPATDLTMIKAYYNNKNSTVTYYKHTEQGDAVSNKLANYDWYKMVISKVLTENDTKLGTGGSFTLQFKYTDSVTGTTYMGYKYFTVNAVAVDRPTE